MRPAPRAAPRKTIICAASSPPQATPASRAALWPPQSRGILARAGNSEVARVQGSLELGNGLETFAGARQPSLLEERTPQLLGADSRDSFTSPCPKQRDEPKHLRSFSFNSSIYTEFERRHDCNKREYRYRSYCA
ncbi:uncharacterized protein IUM83_18611 [Phytophthora cinnamomi]|uniref:uncharacterized protein n=1 Tax=Phytophthora cinnamomi TaxID=4785 RepID=UPI00355A4F9C|nr:hypothetical protein IUM83_18611 [Phytophthora cinnamomi]